MTVLVVDGQGGRLGSQLVKEIVQRFPEHDLLAVGTNSMATERMLKAGAARAATGETPWPWPAAGPMSSWDPWAWSSPTPCWAR